MKYIYSRVSTSDQNVQQQSEFLAQRYERDAIVEEVFTGTTTDRPKFTKLIQQLKVWGVSVYVGQLQGMEITQGVGKLLFTLLSGLAELEREQMLEQQRIGINRAQAEGRYKGRKPVYSELIASAKKLIANGVTKEKAATQLGIGVATLYRRLKD